MTAERPFFSTEIARVKCCLTQIERMSLIKVIGVETDKWRQEENHARFSDDPESASKPGLKHQCCFYKWK